MYESKDESVLPTGLFIRRMVLHVVYALLLIVFTLLLGLAGHLWLESPGWHDALLNTALILGGIGPYIMPVTVGGKIFFSLYSIFVGLVFAATLGLTLAPVAHRLIHKFHLDDA